MENKLEEILSDVEDAMDKAEAATENEVPYKIYDMLVDVYEETLEIYLKKQEEKEGLL